MRFLDAQLYLKKPTHHHYFKTVEHRAGGHLFLDSHTEDNHRLVTLVPDTSASFFPNQGHSLMALGPMQWDEMKAHSF